MRIQIRSTLLAAAACAALAHTTAAAQPMNIVTVGAPAINCLFSTSCSVVVNDHTAPVLGGFLQSRTFQARPGSPMAGKWVYQYRLDLTSAASPSGAPAATSLAIQVPPSRPPTTTATAWRRTTSS